MGEGWTDCIVTFFDLAGVKKYAPSGTGSKLMQCLHDVVGRKMTEDGFETVAKAYVWNDSVLLLAHVDANGNRHERILRDADTLKREIDREIDILKREIRIGKAAKSFAVAVKGLAIPPPVNPDAKRDPRFVYIEASSYAMANCFDIPKYFEEHAGIHDWYVDGRIVERAPSLRKEVVNRMVSLLPEREERPVYAYDGYLWDSASVSMRAECKDVAERDSR